MRLLVAITVLAAFGAAVSASAQDAPAEDAISTARTAAATPSTQEQIDQYLATSPVLLPPQTDIATRFRDAESAGPRQIHGEVEVSVGTEGYRSGSATAIIPIGERGTLALSYSQTENGYGYGYGYRGSGYGYGYDIDGLSAPLALRPDRRGARSSDCESGFLDARGYRDSGWVNDRTGAPERCSDR